jgi:tRNA U34 2-thiouridine synthase MnmA/TrmU
MAHPEREQLGRALVPLERQSGPIVELESGRILGEHPGHLFFTIGPRTGSAGPWR